MMVYYDYSHSKKPPIIKMIMVSILFHFFIFSITLFIPVQIPTKISKRYNYYEVELVELPLTKMKKSLRPARVKKIRKVVPVKIKKNQHIIIAKKTIKIARREKTSDRLIEEAIFKIKRRVKRKEIDRIERAISRIKRKIKVGKDRRSEAQIIEGFTLRLYKLEIENKIKNNWIYPAALVNLKKKDLEAIVILKVKKDGKIIKFWFKKKSNDIIFDNSVIKAIERANPLPPFPEGYKKSYEEIEINFNLSELEVS